MKFQMIDEEARQQINEAITEHFDNELVASMDVETFKGACQDLMEAELDHAMKAVNVMRNNFFIEAAALISASVNTVVKESAHNTFRFVMKMEGKTSQILCFNLDEIEEKDL